MSFFQGLWAFVAGDARAERTVPPSGYSVWLVVFAAAAMTFLAVFVSALSQTTARVADLWSQELSRASTLRITADPDAMEAQVAAALKVLDTTPGIASVQVMTLAEQAALLEPWLGPDVPLELLNVPAMIDVVEDENGFDGAGLRARLAAEVPGAVYDDHTTWRAPLVRAAGQLRVTAALALVLILGALAAMVALAAQAALAANAQVISVLRLVGARDVYIARAFVRRFTLRTFAGAAVGAVVGMIVVALLPNDATSGGFLTAIGFQGLGWIMPVILPFVAGVIAFAATRAAALRMLRQQA